MRVGNIINRTFITVLTHELGHAFGMMDTYARGTLVSTGGLAHTEGKHPSSIMAVLPGLPRPRQAPYLKEDDKNGIIWLYKYYHEDPPAVDCFFPDYVPAKTKFLDKGVCEPRYPLIFEVKHGGKPNVLAILREDPNLDYNARDTIGNTALHYAVMRGQIEIVKALLKQVGIKVNINNKNGRTLAQLAHHLKQKHLAKLIEAHPTAKLLPWAIDPAHSVTTTWGAIKQAR